MAFANKYGLTFQEQAKFLGFGYKTNKVSFRNLNHALKVLWITSIPKISMTSQVFNLNNKIPRELESLFPMFKQEVLFAALKQAFLDKEVFVGQKFNSVGLSKQLAVVCRKDDDTVYNWLTSELTKAKGYPVNLHRDLNNLSTMHRHSFADITISTNRDPLKGALGLAYGSFTVKLYEAHLLDV